MAGKYHGAGQYQKMIDWGLDKIDPNHSIDAIEEDEGKEAILDK